MGWRVVDAVLIGLGGLLPIVGFGLGVHRAWGVYSDLDSRVRAAIAGGSHIGALMDAGLSVEPMTGVAYLQPHIDLLAARREELRLTYAWPFLIAILGVALGTVGGVLALFLPGS